jgi:hypothetical protein
MLKTGKTIGVLAHGLDRGLSGPKYFSGKTNGFLRWIAHGIQKQYHS